MRVTASYLLYELLVFFWEFWKVKDLGDFLDNGMGNIDASEDVSEVGVADAHEEREGDEADALFLSSLLYNILYVLVGSHGSR